MSLEQCRECNEQVSSEAPSCPKCGIKYPIKKKSKLKIWVGAIILVILIMGINHAAEYNARLEKIHELTGANVRQLAAYDAAFTESGLKEGEFLEWFLQVSPQIEAAGGNPQNVFASLRNIVIALSSVPTWAKRQAFEGYVSAGVLPYKFYNLLTAGPAEFDRLTNNETMNISSQSTKDGLEYEKSVNDLKSSLNNLFGGNKEEDAEQSQPTLSQQTQSTPPDESISYEQGGGTNYTVHPIANPRSSPTQPDSTVTNAIRSIVKNVQDSEKQQNH